VITCLVDRAALAGVEWGKPVSSCAVTWGRLDGLVIGWEPWNSDLVVLHAHDLRAIRRVLDLAASLGSAGLCARTPAAAKALAETWPAVEVFDDEGKFVKLEARGVPHVAGWPALDLWRDTGGKLVDTVFGTMKVQDA